MVKIARILEERLSKRLDDSKAIINNRSVGADDAIADAYKCFELPVSVAIAVMMAAAATSASDVVWNRRFIVKTINEALIDV